MGNRCFPQGIGEGMASANEFEIDDDSRIPHHRVLAAICFDHRVLSRPDSSPPSQRRLSKQLCKSQVVKSAPIRKGLTLT